MLYTINVHVTNVACVEVEAADEDELYEKVRDTVRAGGFDVDYEYDSTEVYYKETGDDLYMSYEDKWFYDM